MRLIPWMAIFLLAGCMGPPAARSTLPVNWESGFALLPYDVYSSHSAAHGANLYPTVASPRPATCTAYRTNASLSSDTCNIRDAQYAGEDQGPWVIQAGWAGCPGGGWNGCPEPVEPYLQRVVAFDGFGQVVGFWNGTRGPHTQFATE